MRTTEVLNGRIDDMGRAIKAVSINPEKPGLPWAQLVGALSGLRSVAEYVGKDFDVVTAALIKIRKIQASDVEEYVRQTDAIILETLAEVNAEELLYADVETPELSAGDDGYVPR